MNFESKTVGDIACHKHSKNANTHWFSYAAYRAMSSEWLQVGKVQASGV